MCELVKPLEGEYLKMGFLASCFLAWPEEECTNITGPHQWAIKTKLTLQHITFGLFGPHKPWLFVASPPLQLYFLVFPDFNSCICLLTPHTFYSGFLLSGIQAIFFALTYHYKVHLKCTFFFLFKKVWNFLFNSS